MKSLEFTAPPALVASVHNEYLLESQNTRCSNFLKCTTWSPDGNSLLTASDDTRLRVYDPPLQASLSDAPPLETCSDDSMLPITSIKTGELIYDYCWHPSSSYLASTSRGQPMHMWEKATGNLISTYRAHNQLDDPTSANSIAFDPQGAYLWSGYNRCLRIFSVDRPGNEYSTIPTYTKRDAEGVPGILSCITFNPMLSGMLAAGSYSGGALLIDGRTSELLFTLEGHAGGITHMEFSADGNYLYTGARKDPSVYCWDVRNLSGVVYALHRKSATTNQKISFSIEPCGRHLASGGQDGCVKVWDLTSGTEVLSFKAAGDVVNGADFHPALGLLSTASGHRRFYMAEEEEEGEEVTELGDDENALRIWRFETTDFND